MKLVVFGRILSPRSKWATIRQGQDRESRSALDNLKAFLDASKDIFLPEGYMGDAINCLLNGQDNFCTFLEDGRIPAGNARGERETRHMVIGRKNSLFSVIRSGAECNADGYSPACAIRTNELKPYDYIVYVPEQMMAMKKPMKEKLRNLLPYSKKLPEGLYAKKKES